MENPVLSTVTFYALHWLMLFIVTKTPADVACHSRDHEAVLSFVAWHFDCPPIKQWDFSR